MTKPASFSALRSLVASLVASGGLAAALLVTACGEPQTPAVQGTTAESSADATQGDGKRWSGWRYTGSRSDCFYVVGRHCFATGEEACAAAQCTNGKRCVSEGAGPAQVRCE